MLKRNSNFVKSLAVVLAVLGAFLTLSISSRAASPSTKVLVDNKQLSQSQLDTFARKNYNIVTKTN